MIASEARNRLIAAALRYAAAERGGLDGRDTAAELENAVAELDRSAVQYLTAKEGIG